MAALDGNFTENDSPTKVNQDNVRRATTIQESPLINDKALAQKTESFSPTKSELAPAEKRANLEKLPDKVQITRNMGDLMKEFSQKKEGLFAKRKLTGDTVTATATADNAETVKPVNIMDTLKIFNLKRDKRQKDADGMVRREDVGFGDWRGTYKGNFGKKMDLAVSGVEILKNGTVQGSGVDFGGGFAVKGFVDEFDGKVEMTLEYQDFKKEAKLVGKIDFRK
jgi:hypothetical protein